MNQSETTLSTVSEPVEAVILAAGRGERLHEGANKLKPLTPLLGLTLLERAVLTFQAVGVTDCYIIVGYQQDLMIPHIERLARRYHTRLHAVPNPSWEAGNGTSALAAAPYLQGPCLLSMCDHVFVPAMVRCLLQTATTSEKSLLAVDLRKDDIFDPDDATKVRLQGQKITAIGKELTHYDAIDTGLFFCRAALFEALENTCAAGEGSLTGGVRQLIASGDMEAMPIGNQFWIDVDTPESLEYARHNLLARLTS